MELQALEDRYRELSRQLESSKAKHNQTEATLTRKDYQITQLESSIEMQRRDLNKVCGDNIYKIYQVEVFLYIADDYRSMLISTRHIPIYPATNAILP